MEEIHNTKRKLSTQIKKIKESDKLSKKNKDIILRFYDECYSQGLSDMRVLYYVIKLWKISQWISKDFNKLNKDDIKTLVRKIESSEYSAWTKHGYKLTIKKLYQWLDDYEWNSKEYPDRVKWISLSMKNGSSKLPEEILTKEDIMKLIKATSNVRDKAFLSTLYESGCRIGELLGLRIKDITFDDYGAILIVNGKTGVRRIRLVPSSTVISNWLENHPNKDNTNAFVWTTLTNRNNGRRLSYDYMRLKLRKLAQKGGVQKNVNPHSFRHARATHLATKLSESTLKNYFGWTQASKMASIYVHLSGRDVDNAILRIHGKLSKDEEKRDEEIKSIKCSRCRYENLAGSDFCSRCRLPLSEEIALEMREKEKQFLQMITPEIIEKMIDSRVQEILNSNKVIA